MHHVTHGSHFNITSLLAAALLSVGLVNGEAYAGDYTNFLGIKLVEIPGGSFKMGSCKVTKNMIKLNRKRKFLGLSILSTNCEANNNDVNDNETPQHNVTVQTFKMGATPITLGQYKKYLAEIGAEDAITGWNLINDEFKRLNNYGENAPVVQVSWSEAREFIEWLNDTKPATDKHVYRFASEAEWEYACKAGQNHTYCGSNNLDKVGWVDLNENSNQRDVGTKAPNAWGLYDMTGNAWEWVRDTYHENYIGAPNDGSAWTAHTVASEQAHQLKLQMLKSEGNAEKSARAIHVSNSKFSDEQRKFDKANQGAEWQRDTGYSRVLRGGSWRFGTEMARATYRLSGEPGNWYYGNGFRVAATLPQIDMVEVKITGE